MKVSDRIKKILLNALLWIYVIVCLYPLLYLLFFSFKNNDEIFFSNPLGFPDPLRISNYVHAVTQFNILVFFKNSMIVTLSSIILVLILSLTFSYAVARLSWKGNRVANNYLTLGLFIPTQVLLIPLAVFVRSLHVSNTYLALILPYVAFNLAFSSMIFYGSFRTIPFEMEESAYMDGASIYRTFVQIIVPLIRPAIAMVIVFAFLNIWNEYPVAMILITKESVKTLPLGLLYFTGQFSTDWGPMGAAMVISSIPMIVVYLLLSNQLEKSLSMGAAVKG